jgi:hypothetical protein
MLSSSPRHLSVLTVLIGIFWCAGEARAQGAGFASLAELQPGQLVRLDARTLDQLGAKAKFTRQNRVAPDAHASLRSENTSIKSVPHFMGKFDSGGQTFQYSMVGRRPAVDSR